MSKIRNLFVKIRHKFPKLDTSDQKSDTSVENHSEEHQLKNVKIREKQDDFLCTTKLLKSGFTVSTEVSTVSLQKQ